MSKTVIFSIVVTVLVVGGIGIGMVFSKTPADSTGAPSATGGNVGDNTSGASGLASNECEEQYHKLLNTYGQNFDDCALNLSIANSCAKKTDETTKTKNIVLILDDSGSMAGSVNGEVKMEAVKNAAKTFTASVDPSYNLSVVLYGHKGNNTEAGKAASCSGIDEIHQLGQVNTGALATEISALKANGWTPLGAAIEKAGTILKGKTADKNENLVILLTDGEETCGGNASDAAKKLFGQAEKIVTNVISFDLSEKEAASLQAIASAGHGLFIAAANESDLVSALKENKNFMSGFNCYMEQSSVWLSNDIDVETKYGECENRLETQEKLPLTQAIDFQSGTTESCTTYLQETYEKRYESLKQMIIDAYNSRKGASTEEGQKLDQMNTGLNDNAVGE